MRISDWSSDVCSSDLPKDPKAMPKADREYVLIQSELYPNPDSKEDMMQNKWSNVMFNGGIFKYDPVHDPAATRWLQAKPGERVRVYFVNAGPNEFSSFHPIAGIWDRVYLSGNPANVMHGMQRSEEHTSELQSLMRISYAVFCLKKK